LQCIDYSLDGRAFTKYTPSRRSKQDSGNGGPKVFWYAPAKRWFMALFVGRGDNTTRSCCCLADPGE
jgi:sucrose-6-phosphate hydrolase SacC (GH32 family)